MKLYEIPHRMMLVLKLQFDRVFEVPPMGYQLTLDHVPASETEEQIFRVLVTEAKISCISLRGDIDASSVTELLDQALPFMTEVVSLIVYGRISIDQDTSQEDLESSGNLHNLLYSHLLYETVLRWRSF